MRELLPEVDATIQRLAAELDRAAGDSPTYVVDGEATTGKTTLLLGLRGALADRPGRRPVLVSPPAEAPEVGVLALLELHGELESAGFSTSSIRQTICTPRVAWSEKLRITRELLREHEDRLVLLLDEPSRWRTGESDTPELGRHAAEVYSLLVNYARCPRVVTGALRQGAADRGFRLPAVSSVPTPAASPSFWGALSEAAEALLEGARDLVLARTPLELRLLVSLTHVEGQAEIVRWLGARSGPPSRRDLAARLQVALRRRPDTSRVVDIWTRLALERRPFDHTLLSILGGDALSPEAADLLKIGLLYQERDGLVLHEMLRGDIATDRLDPATRHEVHARLAEYHRTRFEALARSSQIDQRAVLVHEAECVHHIIQTGDVSAIEHARMFFVDQLNILGRTLSKDLKRHADAVTVYRRVLEHEAENAYATHYLAYNLDVQGLAQAEVTATYRRSLELDGTVDRWHAHWIGFLITRGRTEQARAAWDRALDALMMPGISVRDELFAHLHEPVLRLLLHRGQLELARSILDSVPRRLRESIPTFGALGRRLVALEAAARHLAVFPIHIAPEDWWTKGPHLCGWRHRGKPLARWLAARIEDVDPTSQTVTLSTAEPPAGPGANPRIGRMSVSWRDFDEWTENEKATALAPGRFAELAVYEGDGQPLMCCRVHPMTSDLETDLPPLWPPPDRYLTVPLPEPDAA